MALLTGGHLLIEGVPGLAKTLTVKTVAQVLGGSFSRIQFTPDLVPADLVGTRIYRPDSGGFDTETGPVFCNFLLADEINRAPAKVQSALLEVMQERQVTIGKETRRVPRPFLVMATQNPIESEGTYPLPEAQIDRFMMKVVVDYPAFEEETAVVGRSLVKEPDLGQILTPGALQHFQQAAGAVYVDRQVIEYATELAAATRRPDRYGLPDLSPYIAFGASPRGPINLVRAAQAVALLRGRGYVLPQDVEILTKDVFRHRLAPPTKPWPKRSRPTRSWRGYRGGLRAGHRARVEGSRCVSPGSRNGFGNLAAVRTPERPGPGPTPDVLLKALDVKVRRRIHGLMAGDHRSTFAGEGTELSQIRPYVPGDDVRKMDWNATARTGGPHVRVEVTEKALTTWIILGHFTFHDLRHRRSSQGGRGRRGCARLRPPRNPWGEQRRAIDFRG